MHSVAGPLQAGCSVNWEARNLPSFLLLPFFLYLVHFHGSLHMNILHCQQTQPSREQQGPRELDFGGFHAFLLLPRVKLRLRHVAFWAETVQGLSFPPLPSIAGLAAACDVWDLCLAPRRGEAG